MNADFLTEFVIIARHLDRLGRHSDADRIMAEMVSRAASIHSAPARSAPSYEIELSPDAWLEDRHLTMDQLVQAWKDWASTHGSIAGMQEYMAEQGLPRELRVQVMDAMGDPRDYFQGR